MADTLYVALADWIDAYEIPVSGAPNRSRRIHGPSTLLDGIACMTVDASGALYVGNAASSKVTVYDASADGDAAPVRTISNGVAVPAGLATDRAGYLYVLNTGGAPANRNVTVYAPGATGNAAPVRIITGIQSGDANLNDIAIDFFDNLYVSGNVPGFVKVYSAGANGAAVPVRTIVGGLSVPSGMDFDTFNNLYLADGTDVLVFAPSATGPAIPLRTLSGSATGISDDFDLAVDGSNVLYVASFSGDFTQGRVNVFPAGASGNVVPMRVISGFEPARGVPTVVAMRKPRIYTPIPPLDRSKIWELIATLYGGVAVDGGGLVFIGHIPVPVPIGPWGPIVETSPALRDVLVGLGIASLASSIAEPASRASVRRTALETARTGIEHLLTNVR